MSEVEYIVSDIIPFLDEVESNSFDMVYADPWFNVREVKSTKGKQLQTEYTTYRHDYFNWCTEWLKLLGKRMKGGAHLYLGCIQGKDGGTVIPLWNILKKDYWLEPLYMLVWHKPNVNVAFAKKVIGPADFIYDYEFLIYASKGKPRPLNTSGISESRKSVWNISTPIFTDKKVKEKKIHPSQRPIELCRRMVLHSTEEGELVYDAFSGSGVMLLACKQLNRDCIGTDIDPRWKDYYLELAKGTTSILEYG